MFPDCSLASSEDGWLWSAWQVCTWDKCVCGEFGRWNCRHHNDGKTVLNGEHCLNENHVYERMFVNGVLCVRWRPRQLSDPVYIGMPPPRGEILTGGGALSISFTGEGLTTGGKPLAIKLIPLMEMWGDPPPVKTPAERMREVEERVHNILTGLDESPLPELIQQVLYKTLYNRGIRIEGIQARIERLAREGR